MDSFAHAPHQVRTVEVVLVECERGAGDLRRSLLQVWSKDGHLLAEHDRIHLDPVYPAYYLRENVTEKWLSIMGKGGDAIPEADPSENPAPAQPSPARPAINSEAHKVNH